MDLLRGKEGVEEFDITVIIETWVNNESKSVLSEFKIAGCQVFHVERDVVGGQCS